MNRNHRRYLVAFAMPLIAALFSAAALGQHIRLSPLIDSPAEEHPAYKRVSPPLTFKDTLLPLWLKAMQRDDPELRRLAADAISRAHREGMPDLPANAAAPLTALLKAEGQPLVVTTAAAEALIRLDVKDAAPALLELNEKHGGAFAQLTDPALAAWDYKPARKLWNQRIADDLTPTVLRISAVDAVARVGDTGSTDALVALTANRFGSALRLAAARALGNLVPTGLYAAFSPLSRSENIIDRLVAAEALGTHTAPNAREVLIGLSDDKNPVVAGAAVRRLIAADPTLLAVQAETLAKRNDTNLRALAVTILTARADEKSVTTLTDLTGDVNPDVRAAARDSLLALAGQGTLDAAVRRAATAALDDRRWQAREQAAFIIGKLDHEPAGGKLVDRLTDDRFEVRVASLAALRWLADHAHDAAVLARLDALMAQTDDDGMYQRFSEIGQATQYLGAMRYAPADAALRKFIPKKSAYGSQGRVGAIWALGMIHEGEKTADLAGQFAGRLRDWQGMEPESNDVRMMSAIAIGMLKADSQLGTLNSFYDGEMPEPDIATACRWSILQIQPDRDLPEIEIGAGSSTGWFIEPLPER